MFDVENNNQTKLKKSKPNHYMEVMISDVPGLFVRTKNGDAISYNLSIHINGEHKRLLIGKARDINEAQAIELGRELKQRVDNEAKLKRQARIAASLKTHLKTTKLRPKLEGFSKVADAEKFVIALSDSWSLLPTLKWMLNRNYALKHETLKLLLLKMILPHTLSDLLTMTCSGTFENGINAWIIPKFKGKFDSDQLTIGFGRTFTLGKIINTRIDYPNPPNSIACFPFLAALKPQEFKEQIKLICLELHLNSKLNPNQFTDFFKVIAQEHSPFKKEIIEAYANGGDNWREINGQTNNAGIFTWWMDRVLHADFSATSNFYRRPLMWPFNATGYISPERRSMP